MNTDNNTDIINSYQNVYIYSKRYMILILAIIIGVGTYIYMSNFYKKQILTTDSDIKNAALTGKTDIDNPFVLQRSGGENGIILPKNEQWISENTDDGFDQNSYLSKYIYQNSNNSGAKLEEYINKNMNKGSENKSISINNDIIKYFNLSCLYANTPIDLSNNQLCQNNLKEFVEIFPNYRIEEDLGGFEKIITKGISGHGSTICKNILQYIYKNGKIYPNFDSIVQSCNDEKKIYNNIIDLKKFIRDEHVSHNSKKYESQEINELKLVSRMQSINTNINQPKIDLIGVKQYLNWVSIKAYIEKKQNQDIESMIYIFNNQIKDKINIYKSKDNLSVEELGYIGNIINDIDSINTGMINIAKINNGNIVSSGEVNKNTIETGNNESSGEININTKSINKLIQKYIIGSIIDEYRLISENKYLYKISIGNTKRGFLVVKNDQNIWMMKTLFIGKSNGIYTKVNDFSVELDDGEQKRFDAFMSKYQEIYQNLNK